MQRHGLELCEQAPRLGKLREIHICVSFSDQAFAVRTKQEFPLLQFLWVFLAAVFIH